MQTQIKGFLVYNTGRYVKPEHRWDFITYDPRQFKDTDRVVVREEEISVDVPDNFDPRSLQVEMLRQKEQLLRAEFARKVKELNDEINSLLALEAA